MTFTELAIRALNYLCRTNSLANRASRIRRIETRFPDIVYVENRQIYAEENDAVCIGTENYLLEDVSSCEHCDEYCLTDDSRSVEIRSRSGRLITQTWGPCCVDDSFICENCENRFSDDLLHQNGGACYCEECFESVEREDLPSYHNAERFSPDSWKVPLYSGELEVEAEERADLIAALQRADFPKVSWERDGSLAEGKGIEILIQFRESPKELGEDICSLLEAIKKKGLALSSWNNKRCGFHLNSNRHELWNKHAAMRLLYAVKCAKGSLIRISGRESNQWAAWPDCSLKYQAAGHAGKYVALRVGSDRFEWRMFRGTLNPERIKLYCETVNAFEQLALSNTFANKLKSAAVELGKTLANKLNN